MSRPCAPTARGKRQSLHVRRCEKINLIVGAALRGRPDPSAFIGKRATTQGRPYRSGSQAATKTSSVIGLRILLEKQDVTRLCHWNQRVVKVNISC